MAKSSSSVRARIGVRAALGIAALTIGNACSPAQPSRPAAPALDRAALTAQMLPLLRQKQFIDYIGDQRRCSAYFDLLGVTIMDEMLEGRTGRVEAQLILQARNAARADMSESIGCYGAPPGGWAAGQRATAVVVADVEQWNGAWRIVSMPVLRPVQ